MVDRGVPANMVSLARKLGSAGGACCGLGGHAANLKTTAMPGVMDAVAPDRGGNVGLAMAPGALWYGPPPRYGGDCRAPCRRVNNSGDRCLVSDVGCEAIGREDSLAPRPNGGIADVPGGCVDDGCTCNVLAI